MGPLRVRCLTLMGADPNMTKIRGALVEPDLEPAFYAAVRADLACSDFRAWSAAERAVTGSPVGRYARALLARRAA